MIIQKTSRIDAFQDIDSENEWIVTDIDNAISMDKRHIKPTINMIIDDIKASEFVNVYYYGKDYTDLAIVRKKVIYSYGVPTEIKETIVIKDYSYIKNDPAIIPLNRKINQKLKEKIMKKLKKLFPKVVAFKILLAVVTGGVVLYSNNKFNNKEINTKKEYSSSSTNDLVIEFPSESVEETTKVTTVKEITEPTTVEETYSEPIELLKYYCSIYGFDDSIIEQIYKEKFGEILRSDKPEETAMRCVYDFYVENFYEKIPTEYNVYSEDEMETYIINYAQVLGIEDKELLYTMLAVHELETGHGESPYCLEKNNLGGNMITNPYTNEVEIQEYPNAIVGAMDFVMDFYRIYKSTVPEEYQNPNVNWNIGNKEFSIEYYMNPTYCTEKMNDDDPEWYEIVSDIKSTLKERNRLEEVEEMVSEYNSTSRHK